MEAEQVFDDLLNDINVEAKFRALMEDYSKETNKKADHGLKVTKKFKKWIKNHPSLDEFEKDKFLGYCSDYEKQLPKLKIEELQGIVEAQHPGSKITSTEYVNASTKVGIQCAEGHIFEMTPDHLKRGQWCRKCAGMEKLTIEDLQEWVNLNHPHSKITSTKYVNNKTKIIVRCKADHTFEITPNSMKRGRWCPECSEGVSERICRKFFETIFQENFPKSRPDWLVNDRGNQIEFDGYNKELKIAFEYQGIQHYKYIKHFHRNVENYKQRQADDQTKRDLSKKNGVILIEIPYTVKYDKMQEYIIKRCNAENVRIPKNIKKIDYRKLNT